MDDIATLSLPFFGVIFLGYGAGKVFRLPVEGLAWLNTFIIYFALPALFFQLLAETPFEELANGPFVLATVLSTFAVFALAFLVGMVVTRSTIPESAIQGVVGAYSNIGYMGPGLTLAALGPQAAVPTALIFCFDSALLFTLVPILVGLSGDRQMSMAQTALLIARRVFTHPFILATIAGVLAAYVRLDFPAPIDQMLTFLRSAAAPCALFTLGVTVALRPLRRIPWELPLLLVIKLVIHPVLVLVLMNLVGVTDDVWIKTAVLMAALPPALNAFILAQQYQSYVERASSAVLIGTVASVFTVTALLYALGADLVPTTLFTGPAP